MPFTKKQRHIIESLGWVIQIENYSNEKSYYLSQYSPKGEDFGFSINYNKPIVDIKEYYNSFDPEEHANIWIPYRGTKGVPNSIKALLCDAEAIENMLERLVISLERG